MRKKQLPEAGSPKSVPEPQNHLLEADGPMPAANDQADTSPAAGSSEPELTPAAAADMSSGTWQFTEQLGNEETKTSEIEPETGQQSGGKRVAENKESVFESFTKMSESVFSLEGLKKAATWYIETTEKIANQALDFQEKATGWAKYTHFAPLFEAQQSIARKLVERSASAARTLWQIPNQ